MGKTAKARKATVNPRSRAFKRETSPGIDLDKSLKDAPRASDATPVLGARPNGGVTKKQKKKQLTRAQKQRQQKGVERAEAVQDQLNKKLDESQSRLKTRRERRAIWDDINGGNKFEKLNAILGSTMEADVGGDAGGEEPMPALGRREEDGDVKIVDAAQAPVVAPALQLVMPLRTASTVPSVADDDFHNIT